MGTQAKVSQPLSSLGSGYLSFMHYVSTTVSRLHFFTFVPITVLINQHNAFSQRLARLPDHRLNKKVERLCDDRLFCYYQMIQQIRCRS